MARCDLCGKGKVVVTSQKHKRGVAGGQWKKRAPKTKRFAMPNLHYARIKIDGSRLKMRLCTKCLRMMKKGQNQIAVKPSKSSKEVTALVS